MTLAQQYRKAFLDDDIDQMRELIKHVISNPTSSEIAGWLHISYIFEDGSVGGISFHQHDRSKYRTRYSD